jgi:hypothetical protein
MEIIEMIGWLALGFVPMFTCLHVVNRILKLEKMTLRKVSGVHREVLEGGL